MKKHNLKPLSAAVSAGLLLMLSACSGGSDAPKPVVEPPPPPPPPEPTSFNVTVIDGYIRGAIAYIDLNGNKQLDEGEPFTETVEGGEGVIDTTGLGLVPENVSVIVDIPEGAVDESTITDENPGGVPIAEGDGFQLVSLPGENVATPVTTLISLVAGDEGGVEAAKEEVAEQLGITTDEASSDYIADENEELTVLTEVMIANEVIPKNVTEDVDPADIVVATEVSSTIAGVIEQASEAGTLTEQKEVINQATAAVTAAVDNVTEQQSDTLSDVDDETLGEIVEQVADVTSAVYQDLVVSEAPVSDDMLAQAQVQAEIVSDVVSTSIVEQGVSEEGLTEQAVEQIQASAEVIADVVETLLEEQSDSEEGLSEDAIEGIEEVTDIIAGVVEELIADKSGGEEGLSAEEVANVTTTISVVTAIVEQIIESNGEAGELAVEDVTAIAEIVAEEVIEEVEELSDSGLTEEEIQAQVQDAANETASDLEEAIENDVDIEDFDGDGIANDEDDDIDGDGVANENDALPYNENESVDTDKDGIGNNEDTDDDNDGASDDADDFPLDDSETTDTDGDGIGNNADTDDDNDGISDDEDAFPLDESETIDTDGDGTGNNTDTDDDNDGTSDDEDEFPLDESETTDTDGDGTGNNADLDDDNDGVSDEDDLDALNPAVSFGGLADEINRGTMYLLWDEYREFNTTHGDGDLEFETLTVDQATQDITLVSYELREENGEVEFVAQSANDDDEYELLLTENGWQENLNDYRIQSQTKDGTTRFINGVGSIAITTGEKLDSTGLKITDVLEQLGLTGWALNVDQTATFDESAALYRTTFTAGSDDYLVDMEVDCTSCGALRDNLGSSLTQLNGLFVEYAWHSEQENNGERYTQSLAHSENSNGELVGEFLSSTENEGAINLYVYDEGEPRLLSQQGVWRIEEVMGQEIVRLTLPENVESLAGFAFDVEEAQSRFFALVRGYVRTGFVQQEGSQDDNEAWINAAAYEQVIENFSFGDWDNDFYKDAFDSDDDNDGVVDSEDAFVRDDKASADLDNDGIADYLDDDLDGDGVANGEDIAPRNSDVSNGMTLNADVLASAYIDANESLVDDLPIALGSATQTYFSFSEDQSGSFSDSQYQSTTQWQIENNELTVLYNEQPSTLRYYTLEELVDLALIDVQDAKNYCYDLNCGLEISTTLVKSTLWLIGKDDSVVDFWRRNEFTYSVSDAYDSSYPGLREIVQSSSVSDAEYQITMLDIHAVETSPFDEQNVQGQWVLPTNFNDDRRLRADLLTFNADGTATGLIHDEAFTWQVHNNGQLSLVNEDQSITLVYSKFEEYEDGAAIYAQVTVDDETIYGHHFGMKASGQAIEFSQINQFLINSFTLGDDYYRDDEGNIRDEEIFGFYFHDDSSVNRIFGSNLIDGYGPETWRWQQDESSLLSMSRYRNIYSNNYDDNCTRELVDSCYIWRNRYWQPISQSGDRLYVLEWSEYDGNYNPNDPNWVELIPARLNFYQAHQSDLVDANVNGNDRDLDGIPNEDDAFPFDSFEWLDTDGDGIGNNADSDDDGDNVVDWEDALPLDETETSDVDGDGIGDIADTDDDNDGIDDTVDLDPLDPDVSEGLFIDVSELASKYIRLSDGYLDEPSISLSQITGEVYTFDFDNDQVGKVQAPSGSMNFSFEDAGFQERLNYTSNNSEVRVMNVDDLLEFGYVSEQAATQYSNAYGSQVEVTVVQIRAEIVWLENGETQDRFWWTDVESWQIAESSHREILFGSVDAQAIELHHHSYEVILTEYDSLSPIDYTLDEVVGNWGLPVTFDTQPELTYQRIIGDYATFNADNTGSAMISGSAFTWQIDSGKLIVNYNNGAVIELERIESTESGDVVVASASFEENDYSVVRLSTKADSDASYTEFVGDFLMNSFTLTNSDAYDGEGEIVYEDYYGFKLNDDNTVNRIYDGDFDFNSGFGTDNWYWTELSSNEIQLTALVEKDMYSNWVSRTYASCDIAEDNCYEWRKRHWKVLKETDDRIYVLEWAFWDQNIWDQNAQEQNFELVIPPRVQFYQKFALDTDKDGMRDDVDMDDDNDGFTDENDDFPFDRDEWLDTDGDGIGNNSDDDDDNDGVYDWNDPLPLDASETMDSDNDGIGDNADSDDDNDGISDENDAAPLDDSIGAALPLTEDNLSSSYMHYVDGYLDTPSISIGSISGDLYSFVDGAGKVTSPDGQLIHSYSFANNTLTLDLSQNEASKQFLSLNELAYQGVLTFEAVDRYLSAYGNSQIYFYVTTEKVEFNLLAEGDESDRFLVTEFTGYQVVEESDREILFGSIDAEAVVYREDSRILELLDLDTFDFVEYTDAEVIGNWGLPTSIDRETTNSYQKIRSDYLSFNDNFTGTSEFSGSTFTWQVTNGNLALDFDNGDNILLRRIQSSEGGDVVLATATIDDIEHSVVSLSIKESLSADYNNFIGQFLMNSFTLTNSDVYNDAGEVKREEYFGFMLDEDNSAIRILGDYDFETEQGISNWTWSELSSNEITLSAHTEVDENGNMLGSGLYSICDITSVYCKEWRRRHWRVLAETEERIFVLEWEFWGPPIEAVDEGEEFNLIITPRVQFYQKFELED
ncbi:hypothetical protein [Thalassotalea eurytherma]|uniref:Uncharacterized protein n=1 Tax=Thalassotalea eurytherma TaxID=1144278 RepID=A0ABQ6H2Z4_9GAMM|nr:hypothetical protein [Thalassotalea eurytherma]GLX82545.1 hypothetical protein theurythT_19970 [Thalassotalea eurytherma]